MGQIPELMKQISTMKLAITEIGFRALLCMLMSLGLYIDWNLGQKKRENITLITFLSPFPPVHHSFSLLCLGFLSVMRKSECQTSPELIRPLMCNQCWTNVTVLVISCSNASYVSKCYCALLNNTRRMAGRAHARKCGRLPTGRTVSYWSAFAHSLLSSDTCACTPTHIN